MGLVMGTFPMQSKQVNYHTGKSISLRFMTVALIVLKQLDFFWFSGKNLGFFAQGKHALLRGS